MIVSTNCIARDLGLVSSPFCGDVSLLILSWWPIFVSMYPKVAVAHFLFGRVVGDFTLASTDNWGIRYELRSRLELIKSAYGKGCGLVSRSSGGWCYRTERTRDMVSQSVQQLRWCAQN